MKKSYQYMDFQLYEGRGFSVEGITVDEIMPLSCDKKWLWDPNPVVEVPYL